MNSKLVIKLSKDGGRLMRMEEGSESNCRGQNPIGNNLKTSKK
jgi:hypothetical protein